MPCVYSKKKNFDLSKIFHVSEKLVIVFFNTYKIGIENLNRKEDRRYHS